MSPESGSESGSESSPGQYREWQVAPGVDLWRSGPEGGQVGGRRILPDGCLDVILLGERLVVAGPDAVARVLPAGPGERAVAVRLHGGRGAALLGVPADDLTGSSPELAALWGRRRADRLLERVRDDPRALAAWAVDSDPDPVGDELLRLLSTGFAVGAAADALALSARQLQRRSRTAFGYGPQHLARVLRLQRGLALADRGVPWATVATMAGFSDQAHLARDVRDLTGLPPTRLLEERTTPAPEDVRSVQDGTVGSALASRP